jgi:hypothetical protein
MQTHHKAMRKLALIALVMWATMFYTHQGCAQGSLTALFLSTTGSGSVTPLQNGQVLEAGQSYTMTAVPADGFEFSSWEPANFFVFTDDTQNPRVVSTVESPVPNFIETPDLTFTEQPGQVILEVPGVRTVEQFTGWQANFEPVPEPSCLVLELCGLA